MGKYDDAIGGGEFVLSVKEILDEPSAAKVDKQLQEQRNRKP